MTQRTRVALALGSGGARGYAHIGVIRALEERGCEIVTLAGSSMGALVGGLYAAGRLDEYTTWARGLRQLDVVRLLDLSLSAPGAIRAEKVLGRVRELLAGALIEELPIPFTAVATDLLAGREVWFQDGPVDVAIRASIAIPGVVTPLMLNGRLLADGGVMNPVPIAPTSAVASDLTVAVSLAGEDGAPHGGPAEQETAEARPLEEWTDRFRASASSLLDRDVVRSLLQRFGGGQGDVPEDISALAEAAPTEPAVDEEDEPPVAALEALPAGLGKFDMMNRSLEAMQSVLIRYRLAGYPPDLLISVPRTACRIVDFHRAAELIDLGYDLASAALDRAGVAAVAEPAPDPPQAP